MSYGSRPTGGGGLSSHVRASSGLGGNIMPTQQTSSLQARINEKRLELESLKQLRDLSAGLAGQMQQLEEKLATLSNGTEVVAAVMGNWATVLRAIHMASAHIPKPKSTDDGDVDDGRQLPQTLVRIPIQQAEAAQREEQQQQQRSNAGAE